MPRAMKRKKSSRRRSFKFNNTGYAYANEGHSTRSGYRGYRDRRGWDSGERDERNDLVSHSIAFARPTALDVVVKIWRDAPYVILNKINKSVMLTVFEFYDLLEARDCITYHLGRAKKVLSGMRVRQLDDNFTELPKSALRLEAERELDRCTPTPDSADDDDDDDDVEEEEADAKKSSKMG